MCQAHIGTAHNKSDFATGCHTLLYLFVFHRRCCVGMLTSNVRLPHCPAVGRETTARAKLCLRHLCTFSEQHWAKTPTLIILLQHTSFTFSPASKTIRRHHRLGGCAKKGRCSALTRANYSPNILVSVTAISTESSALRKDSQGCISAGRHRHLYQILELSDQNAPSPHGPSHYIE